jgi:hypothetical protein
VLRLAAGAVRVQVGVRGGLMQRQHFMVSDNQMKWLRKVAKDKGVSMSEILRAAIDAYMVQSKEGGK